MKCIWDSTSVYVLFILPTCNFNTIQVNELEVGRMTGRTFSPILILKSIWYFVPLDTTEITTPGSIQYYQKIYKMPIEENTRAIIEFVKYPIWGP